MHGTFSVNNDAVTINNYSTNRNHKKEGDDKEEEILSFTQISKENWEIPKNTKGIPAPSGGGFGTNAKQQINTKSQNLNIHPKDESLFGI